MLARLSMATARLLDVHFEPSDMSTLEDETLVVDISTLRTLVFPLPDFAWRQMAGMCGRTITPMYKTIHTMLSEDMEHVVQVLSELEPPSGNNFDDNKNCDRSMALLQLPSPSNAISRHPDADARLGDLSPQERPHRKRRRSSNLIPDHPLIIRSTHPSIPTIIITPCLPQPREISCRVPYQDSAFRNKLTIPTHPVFNHVFPPTVLPTYVLPVLEKWRWLDGHWQAILPDFDEQTKKGMFSRALTVKKRACRTLSRVASCCEPRFDP